MNTVFVLRELYNLPKSEYEITQHVSDGRIKQYNNLETIPRIGENIIIDNFYYTVSSVLYDLDNKIIILRYTN